MLDKIGISIFYKQFLRGPGAETVDLPGGDAFDEIPLGEAVPLDLPPDPEHDLSCAHLKMNDSRGRFSSFGTATYLLTYLPIYLPTLPFFFFVERTQPLVVEWLQYRRESVRFLSKCCSG